MILLKTAYEWMLNMGVVFFPLAFTTCINGALISKMAFAILIVLLFFSNIPPRNKIMRLLEHYAPYPGSPQEAQYQVVTKTECRNFNKMIMGNPGYACTGP